MSDPYSAVRPAQVSPAIPSDLSLWTGKSVLSQIVHEAIHEFKSDWPATEWSLTDGKSFSTERLLALLAFSYATGIYSSEEIEVRSRQDPWLRNICGERCPGMNLLRSVRRGCRTLLENCLVRILEESWSVRFGQPHPDWQDSFAVSLRQFLEKVEKPCLEAEMRFRIDRAVLFDSMSLDI